MAQAGGDKDRSRIGELVGESADAPLEANPTSAGRKTNCVHAVCFICISH
ncbi:hypothetical protein Scep_026159 [Stephania cephalantha]|uniref:Uncharacterized protein n=1 Tax=Stephania cephalantha TaxID=152367 RepID=A0AAP0EJL1_9MAGN